MLQQNDISEYYLMNMAHKFKPFWWTTETIASLFRANQLNKTQTWHLQEHKYCYVLLKYKRLGKYGESGFTTAYNSYFGFFSCLFMNPNLVFTSCFSFRKKPSTDFFPFPFHSPEEQQYACNILKTGHGNSIVTCVLQHFWKPISEPCLDSFS